jgi:hypothetical protein
MLHYSTRDIITRARELADLENSNFITWAENMKLLDECYKKLPQWVLDAIDEVEWEYLPDNVVDYLNKELHLDFVYKR